MLSSTDPLNDNHSPIETVATSSFRVTADSAVVSIVMLAYAPASMMPALIAIRPLMSPIAFPASMLMLPATCSNPFPSIVAITCSK